MIGVKEWMDKASTEREYQIATVIKELEVSNSWKEVIKDLLDEFYLSLSGFLNFLNFSFLLVMVLVISFWILLFLLINENKLIMIDDSLWDYGAVNKDSKHNLKHTNE